MKPINFKGAYTSNERKRELTNYYSKLFADNNIDTNKTDLVLTLDMIDGGYAPKNIQVDCSNLELKNDVLKILGEKRILE